MAIRIGTRGEEPPPSLSCEETGVPEAWPGCCRALPCEPVGRSPGLPCPVPPFSPVAAAPPADEDGLPGPPVEDPAPDESEGEVPDSSGTEAPPFTPEECAGGWLCVVG